MTFLQQRLRPSPAVRISFALFFKAIVPLALCFSTPAGGVERTRGVRLLTPGEPMVPRPPRPDAKPALPPPPPLETIRIAVANGDDSRLKGLVAHEAPFEVVETTAHPDLVWDAVSHNVTAGQNVIAYGIAKADLAAVIDRTATLHGLRKLAAAQPQEITLAVGSPIEHKGDKITLAVDNIAKRALILVDISGDGTVHMLYPLGSDERIVQNSPFRLELEMRDPLGTDAIVAVSAEKPMPALEDGLNRISTYPSAAKVLDLITATVPKDAKIGVLSVTTAP